MYGAPAVAGDPAVPGSAFDAVVVRVVDGDTFLARSGERRSVRVRLIGIDAPETVAPNRPVGCFGPQASALAHELLAPGTHVRAAYEAGGQTDRFGRDLWDVWLPDGRFLAGAMVDAGAAKAYRIRPQTQHADVLARREVAAREKRVGLFGAC